MKVHYLFLALALGLGGCAAVAPKREVKTSSSILASMTGHKTYAYDLKAPPPEGHTQWSGTQTQIAGVKERIDAAMQAKGYSLSPSPHLVIRISMGLRTIPDPSAVRGAGSPNITEQELDIDVFDFANNTHLFHGTASNPLGQKPPSESTIAESVPSILEPVPPASS